MSSEQYGRKPIWCDPVDLSLDSDDSDAPLPPPSLPPPSLPPSPPTYPSRAVAHPRMYAFPPSPPPTSPPPPPVSKLSSAARDALTPSQALARSSCKSGSPTARTSADRGSLFRVYPDSSIIFQPNPSSGSSNTSSSSDMSDDASDTGTDRSGSEKLDTLATAAIAATTDLTDAKAEAEAADATRRPVNSSNSSVNAAVPNRILKRMSSVTLVEADAEAPSGRRVKPATVATSSSSSSHAPTNTSMSSGTGSSSDDSEAKRPLRSLVVNAETCEYDTDDELRYMREVEGAPIPLNCVTQEKVLYPQQRQPKPSAAAGMCGQQQQQVTKNSSSELHTSKRLDSTHTSSSSVVVPALPVVTVCDIDAPAKQLKLTRELTRERSELSLSSADACGTLLVYQPTCLDHHNDTHQENRERLGVLCGPNGVLHNARFRSLEWANLHDLRPARLNDLLRVHSFEYIQHLERACGRLPDQDASVSVGALYDSSSSDDSPRARTDKRLLHSDWLQTTKAQKVYAVANPPSTGSLDMDSPISKSSYLAARLAAGAVCHAIDKVVQQETKNAFVIVRPPGHHAGPNGCVEADTFHRRPEMCTCGFCLLNNVAIGAAYAMSTYAPPYYSPLLGPSHHPSQSVSIERIAIVDFDIHHGNGTEECIRNLVPHTQAYPLPPSWAPLQFASYKPWRDERDVDNVFFASIHLFDDDNFYPCSGSGPHGSSPELRQRANVVNLPLDVLGPKFLDERLKLSAKAKKQLMAQASTVFRDAVSTQLVPALTRFRPDLILVSAGFDGHADDFYYYLSEDDYGWITEQITAVADTCCNGRVVSVLEGGYNVVPDKSQLRPTTKKKSAKNSNFHYAAKLHNREVDDELLGFGSLARSCASHVMALQRASGSGDSGRSSTSSSRAA